MQTQATTSLNDIVPYQSIPERFPHLYSVKSWTASKAGRGLSSNVTTMDLPEPSVRSAKIFL
ncbi:hypothetical protein [Candidatus Methylobacter favarea]|uniref:hypothetical protein n=1 Tax=Candidatus Methylobacter favarea TaxID=2707345 RepID=UPI00157CDE6F|nr:hypothetical protein [Candidatus Methylobacter favarea]